MTELDGVFFKEIVEQGLREFPNECCGIIAAGRRGPSGEGVSRPEHRRQPVTYRLDGKEQLRVSEEIDERGWRRGRSTTPTRTREAYPSPTDREQAFYPETRYVIVSLQDRDEPVLRSFFIRDGEVTEEELTIA